MEKHNSLDQVYNILEKQEREIFYKFHEDTKRREEIIRKAMSEITVLKLVGLDLDDNLVLLEDTVTLELDYGNDDVIMETSKLVINAENDSELSLYTNIGNAIFAKKVGEMLEVPLVTGGTVNVTIMSKNNDLLDEKENDVSYKK